jgi:hypothetical protein
MADDPFYSPVHRSAPRVPRPGEPLWELHANHVTWNCELRYQGEFGVEAQIFGDGRFFAGRRFDTRALAVQWAELERQARMKDGHA